MEKLLKRNIRIIYGLAFVHAFMLIVPVLVPFFQSKGLTLAEVFYLQAIYAASIVILEAPSGYIADTFGRRTTLVAGAIAHELGYLWLFLVEPPLDPADPTSVTSSKRRNVVSFREIWQHLTQGDPILRLVFLALPIYSLTNINVTWLVQPYWDSMGLSLAMFGVLWCAQCLTVAIANQCGFALERKKGAVFALLVIGLLPLVGIFGMAFGSGWLGVGMGFVMFFCRGLYQVILVNALNRRVPGRFRATVSSLNSLLMRMGFIVTGPLLGFVADRHGVSIALSLVGLGTAIGFVLVMMPLIQAVKDLQASRAQSDASPT